MAWCRQPLRGLAPGLGGRWRSSCSGRRPPGCWAGSWPTLGGGSALRPLAALPPSSGSSSSSSAPAPALRRHFAATAGGDAGEDRTDGEAQEGSPLEGLELPAGVAPIRDASSLPGVEDLIRGVPGRRRPARRCSGCGAWLHSNKPEEHGYIPPQAWEQFSESGLKKTRKEPMGAPVDWVPNGVEVMRDTSSKYKERTRQVMCERCYRLQHYHRLDRHVEGGFYRMEAGRQWEHEAEIIEKVVRRMRKGSLVVMVVDILDFESSLVPELFDACRNRRFPVLFVVNKVDCLPGASREGGLDRVKLWVRRMSRQIRNLPASDVVLVSAKTGLGFQQLEDRLRHHLDPMDPKWIYTLGRVNAGKSTFVNRFLWYIGYKHQGTVHHKRTVGGVTRSAVPGTTLHFVSFALPKGFRIVDTPGIPSKTQITSHLSEGIDLFSLVPRKRLNPISYVLHSGRSFLAGALVRIDQVSGNISFLTSFFSLDVTLHVCRTSRVEELLDRKAGQFFYPPHSREDWERLGPLVRHRVEVFGSSDRAWDDIVIAGMGWVAISGYGTKELDVWVPRGVKVFRRPSLLPSEMRSKGVTRFHTNHRARSPRIYRKKQAIVRGKRDKELRNSLRKEQEELEAQRAAEVELPEDVPFVEEGLELPGFEVVTTGAAGEPPATSERRPPGASGESAPTGADAASSAG